jgi:exonuclease III
LHLAATPGEASGHSNTHRTPQAMLQRSPVAHHSDISSTPRTATAGRWAYTGGFSGICWNCQALFSPNLARQHCKRRHLARILLHSPDFVLLQETHATAANIHVWAPPAGYRFFHSNGTTASAGVGILVKLAFLSKFDAPSSSMLVEIVPGRVGALRLQGAQGGMDIVVVYLSTGDAAEERAQQRSSLAKALRSPASALSVVGGDFNYTAFTEDRVCFNTLAWTGQHQTAEEEDFRVKVGTPFQTFEMEQDDYTHRSGLGTSRIDRIYINFDASRQLDHTVACVALPWPATEVSAHRPLLFHLTPPRQRQQDFPYIPDYIVDHADWKHRVVALHQHWLRQEAAEREVDALRSLVLLKRAMQSVSSALMQEGQSSGTATPPGTPKEKLSHLMRFFRSVDRGRWQAARNLAALAPELLPFINITERGGTMERALHEAKAATHVLAKQLMVEELRELQAAAADLPEATAKAKRQQLGTRLKRLKLGTSTSLRAVMKPDGSLATQPADIMLTLQGHWAKVFTGAAMPTEAIQHWLQQAYPNGEGLESFPSTEAERWKIRRRDVARAVRCAGHSAPGPDGLPYAAWKAAGAYGVDALWQAAKRMGTEEGCGALDASYGDEEACHFNLGLLCCLPKKPTGSTQDGEPAFLPSDTRPLAIVDTANRLIANAARLRWEKLLVSWIHPAQRGFLPHRSMLANVIDLEESSVETNLVEEDGAAVLFDFSAAFPSIAHDFLLAVLAHIGVPLAALAFIKALYHKTGAQMQMAGTRGGQFQITAGIRQGCPLSPLLFVVTLDGLIRRMLREIPGVMPRMYADDTAVVVKDMACHLPLLYTIFQDLEAAANLNLNLKKCVLIPLGDRPLEGIPQALASICPRWVEMKPGHYGTYLGFAVGPGKANHSWTTPLRKAWEKMLLWDWGRLGLFFAISVWNMHILPSLTFVAQLEHPPAAIIKQTEAMLRKVGYGPGGWCQTADLLHLRRGFGFAAECRSLAETSRAAMMRVYCWEDSWHEGLRVSNRVARLRPLVLRSPFITRCGRWADWHRGHPLEALAQNQLHLEAECGIRRLPVENELAKEAPRPWTTEVLHRVRGGFQKAVRQALEARTGFHAESRVRSKLDRFGIRDRRQATRCTKRLRSIAAKASPRVFAASFGAIWNRWATGRRRQHRGRPCLLGCPSGEDSLEHYCQCPRVWRFGETALRVSCRISGGRDTWFLSAPEHGDSQDDPRWWLRIGLLHYAVMRATNGLRAAGAVADQPEEAHRAMMQGLADATRREDSQEP